MKVSHNEDFNALVNNIHLELLDGGYAQLDSAWREENVCSPFSRLYYVRSGEGVIDVGGRRVRLVANRVYLIPTGLVFGYSCADKLEKVYFHVNITRQNGVDVFHGLTDYYELPLTPERTERIAGLYFSRSQEDAFALYGELMGDAAEFLRLSGAADGEGMKAYSRLTQQVFSKALHPVSARNSVRSLASELHVSESTLTKTFKSEVGMTLGAYLDQTLVRRCCQMLLSTDLPLRDVAERLGYIDQFYFSRYFKKHVGETPSGYRKKWRKAI